MDKPEKIEVDEKALRMQNIRIAVTRADFMTKMPRFYKAFDYVDMWPFEKIDTLCVAPIYDKGTKELTGKHDLMWSPKFTAQLSDKQLLGVQMHELLHILLGHTTNRSPKYKSFRVNAQGQGEIKDKEDQAIAEIWNISTDLAINSMIKDFLKDPAGLQKIGLFPGEGNFANLPELKNAEFYFEELMKQHKQDMKDLDKLLKELKKMFQEGKIGSHGEWVETDGKGKVTKEGSAKAGGRKDPDKEDKENEAKEDDVTADDIAKDLQEIAEDCGLTAGDSTGTTKYADLSAGKEKKTPGWMKKTTHASIHGFEVATIATRKVPNRRYGILFPGKKRVAHRNKCLIAVDVSGSINRPLLVKFTEHLNKMKKYADFDLFFFNSSIIDKSGNTFDPSEGEKALCKWKTGMQFHVGGGTDFEPLLKFWNRVRVKYDSFFIFTDGEANYSTPPSRSREVNWILYASSSYWTNAIKHGNKYNINDKVED